MIAAAATVSRLAVRRAGARTMAAVPVIDIGPFLHGSEQDRKAVARELASACENVGFMSVTNHGVSPEVIDACWNSTRAFFDQDEETKKQTAMSEEYIYGYENVEVLSAGKDAEEGVEAVEALPDLKETWSVGPYNPAAGMPEQRWPATPASFHPDVHAYYVALEGLATNMLDLFAAALELPEGWFADKSDKHCAALRLLNYPERSHPPAPGQFRASPHTDYGALTILRQDGPGLQVQAKDGSWVDAPPHPDHFVINLGDLMARWTNDKWRSTMHRVVELPGAQALERRQSIAFFYNINADAMVSCIDTCQGPGNPPKYEPIKAMDLIMQKHMAAVANM